MVSTCQNHRIYGFVSTQAGGQKQTRPVDLGDQQPKEEISCTRFTLKADGYPIHWALLDGHDPMFDQMFHVQT